MTTQTQGKGKKKNKEVVKVSLDEFNQLDAPLGHSVVNLKVTTLDWAATMAQNEQAVTETQQVIVPTAPRAQRGPTVDLDLLPNDPPFRADLFNLPMSMEEEEIAERFFRGLKVLKVDSNRTYTTVEFETRDDLYEALCKDGVTLKGRTVNVCLYGQQPQNSYNDRYGGRGGNSSYSDRYGDRGSGGFGSRSNDRYGDRSGGFGRDRDSGFGREGGYNRGVGGFGQQRSGGFGGSERYNPDRNNFRDSNRGYTSGGGEPDSEEPANWRSRPTVKPTPPTTSLYNNNGSRPYMARSETSPYRQQQQVPSNQYQSQPESYYQPRYQPHNQPQDHSPSPSYNQASMNNRSTTSSTAEERPKLIIHKRKTPINTDDVSGVKRNEAIFGQAKPSSKPYEKMSEIEEKLSAVRVSDRKASPHGSSQAGSQPGSAPRSRRVSERSGQ